MGAKFEVNISNTAAYSILAAALIIVAVVGVYASGVANTNQGSHEAGQITVKINNTEYNLQEILGRGISPPTPIGGNATYSPCVWTLSKQKSKGVPPKVEASTLKYSRVTGSCICGKGTDVGTIMNSLGDKTGSWMGYLRNTGNRDGVVCVGMDAKGRGISCNLDYFVYLSC